MKMETDFFELKFVWGTLEHLSFEVALVGSRLLGLNRSDSDWDYIAEHTKERELELLAHGWINLTTDRADYLQGGNTICVFEKDNMQISLQVDIYLEERVYRSLTIEKYMIFHNASKSEQSEMWNKWREEQQ